MSAVKKENDDIKRSKIELEEKIASLEQSFKSSGNDYDDVLRKRQELNFPQIEVPFSENGNRLFRTNSVARSAVKGRLLSLVTPKDSKFALGLEIAAGPKLLNIVVENDEVGGVLLQEKAFNGKVTLLPLNKITGATIDPNKLAFAQEKAKELKGRIWNPLELLSYAPEIQRAVEFAWGNRLLASSLEVAQAVVYGSKNDLTVVTLDGDVLSPSGALEGGFRENVKSLFQTAMQYKELNDRLQVLAKAKEERMQMRSQLEAHQHEHQNLKRRFEENEMKKITLEGKLKKEGEEGY